MVAEYTDSNSVPKSSFFSPIRLWSESQKSAVLFCMMDTVSQDDLADHQMPVSHHPHHGGPQHGFWGPHQRRGCDKLQSAICYAIDGDQVETLELLMQVRSSWQSLPHSSPIPESKNVVFRLKHDFFPVHWIVVIANRSKARITGFRGTESDLCCTLLASVARGTFSRKLARYEKSGDERLWCKSFTVYQQCGSNWLRVLFLSPRTGPARDTWFRNGPRR